MTGWISCSDCFHGVRACLLVDEAGLDVFARLITWQDAENCGNGSAEAVVQHQLSYNFNEQSWHACPCMLLENMRILYTHKDKVKCSVSVCTVDGGNESWVTLQLKSDFQMQYLFIRDCSAGFADHQDAATVTNPSQLKVTVLLLKVWSRDSIYI